LRARNDIAGRKTRTGVKPGGDYFHQERTPRGSPFAAKGKKWERGWNRLRKDLLVDHELGEVATTVRNGWGFR